MSKTKFATSIDRIRVLVKQKSVIIHLDTDGTSTLAQQDSILSYDKKTKILEIVIPQLSDNQKEQLFKIIREVHEEGGLLWKETKNQQLLSYEKYISQKKDKKTIEFFSTILSQDDFSALKMSLFLRAQSIEGKDIANLKRDIVDRFGKRGGNIANLCTAGYFEEEFEPLYNISTPKSGFYDYYEMVVGEGARALFVHMNMTDEDIENEVESMVQKALQYHMPDFRIHAKGTGNVSAIKKFVNTRTGSEDYSISLVWDNPGINAIEYYVKIKRTE